MSTFSSLLFVIFNYYTDVSSLFHSVTYSFIRQYKDSTSGTFKMFVFVICCSSSHNINNFQYFFICFKCLIQSCIFQRCIFSCIMSFRYVQCSCLWSLPDLQNVGPCSTQIWSKTMTLTSILLYFCCLLFCGYKIAFQYVGRLNFGVWLLEQSI